MPVKVIVEMLDDGDGWDRMRRGSTEITHFFYINTVPLGAFLTLQMLIFFPNRPNTTNNNYLKRFNIYNFSRCLNVKSFVLVTQCNIRNSTNSLGQ